MQVIPYPGAKTVILIGPVPALTARDLRPYRAILWLDQPAGTPPPASSAGTSFQALAAGATNSLTAALEAFLRLDARRLPTVMVGDTLPEASRSTVRVVTELLNQHHGARVTRQQDGFRWQKHLLQNLPAYARRPVPTKWENALTGRPAVICGAGPSLDISAPLLAKIADQVVIFAADSALRTLAKHGVKADFVVSVDVAKEPGRCLIPDQPPPARVLLAAISPPAWHDAVPADALFFLGGNQITTDWIATLGVPKPPVPVTESCGVTALTMARFMGCGPLYLFGLDLALSTGETTRRHNAGADAALYVNSGFNAQSDFPEVPGNHTATVPTHALADWRALDTRLTGWPAGLVINVNDRGARLANTTVIHPDAFTFTGAAGKSDWLATLADTRGTSAETVAAMLSRLSQCGDTCVAALPGLQAAFAKQGPAGLAQAFRPLLADPAVGRALGAFSLKLMPHLLPPIEGDDAFWQGLLQELDELNEILRGLR